ncbi:CatB-related O-acetyltransferase [Rosistilla oblonga]|uniref:Streptogramin A acetyltransferase n=1 Tax=Rosistilla oblonga TaxID=2527990 RepID=A0A518IRL2_9BACT|nr:CatB-related O-acetyltransferase [Rosistilla oblonga]QDV55724.1 Streptogramin A acetyltransferase [Rosistilla oblonga]
MHGPDPHTQHPLAGFPQVGYLKPILAAAEVENIIVGDYTYYDDPAGPERFIDNVLYHFPFIGDKLTIGKFCAIGRGVKFIMNGANHPMDGVSTYPFWIFGNGWESNAPAAGTLPHKGDTVVENDVWIGYEATIMPGVKIGNGAIIAAKSVVTSDVPAYTIVGGNPAREIRRRFAEPDADRLESIAWWDWPAPEITQHLASIAGADIDELERAITAGE